MDLQEQVFSILLNNILNSLYGNKHLFIDVYRLTSLHLKCVLVLNLVVLLDTDIGTIPVS